MPTRPHKFPSWGRSHSHCLVAGNARPGEDVRHPLDQPLVVFAVPRLIQPELGVQIRVAHERQDVNPPTQPRLASFLRNRSGVSA